MNWLVIGIGDITTKRVIPAIQAQPRSTLHAILTRSPGKAAPYREARVYTRLDEALRDSEIDAVYVATPVSLHAPQTIAALRAGKHVLCEKPVGLNCAEAGEMVRVAAETGRVLGIAYYRRMYPKLQRAKALLESGAIGQPVLAEANCHYWYNDTGPDGWRLKKELAGGGPLYDIASHRIDAFNFLFGSPARVSAHLSNVVHRNPVEDNATVLIDYESGVRGVVDVRWHSKITRDDFRIIGTEGDMVLTPLNGPLLSYAGGTEYLPAHPNLHYPCVDNFVNAALDGAHLYASGESSIVTDRVTELAIQASPAA